MFRILKGQGLPVSDFHRKYAIQLNDTHPAIAVAELMRLLIDEHGLDWDSAWTITTATISYTNHTLLPEALEAWNLELFEQLLPRQLEIIYEINARFLKLVRLRHPGNPALLEKLSLIEEGPQRRVRMAHLAVVGSHKVNGVAELHSELLRQNLFHDFATLWPERFTNITNGVTPRRWLAVANRVGRHPTLDYADCVLNNWERIDPLGGITPENVRLLHRFTGLLDEEWFLKTHVIIESEAAGAISAIYDGYQAVKSRDIEALLRSLSWMEQVR
jgi:starch phosphorylase